jgi:hypothetical protein
MFLNLLLSLIGANSPSLSTSTGLDSEREGERDMAVKLMDLAIAMSIQLTSSTYQTLYPNSVPAPLAPLPPSPTSPLPNTLPDTNTDPRSGLVPRPHNAPPIRPPLFPLVYHIQLPLPLGSTLLPSRVHLCCCYVRDCGVQGV